MHNIPDLDKNGLREFGLTTGAMVAGVFGILFPWLFGLTYPLWPWVVGAILGSVALVAPMSLRGVYGAWMRFALLLSKVTTPIIMGVVFLVAILPAAIIMKLIRRDVLNRRLDADMETYRQPSEDLPVQRLEKPY